MTDTLNSAPGFGAARPYQVAVVRKYDYQVPVGEPQGTASFPASYRALDAPIVALLRGAAEAGRRRIPHLGVGTSTRGRATDVDDNKEAPLRQR